MKLSSFLEGLNILKSYYDNPDGCHTGAEHDQFYAYRTNRPLTMVDVQKMRDLGWFQPDTDEGEYSTEDGWSAFT